MVSNPFVFHFQASMFTSSPARALHLCSLVELGARRLPASSDRARRGVLGGFVPFHRAGAVPQCTSEKPLRLPSVRHGSQSPRICCSAGSRYPLCRRTPPSRQAPGPPYRQVRSAPTSSTT
nr:unnamed protein product [Digitaria exilis]